MLKFEFMCYLDITTHHEKQYDFAKGDYDKIREQMGEHDWQSELKEKNIDESWSYIERILNTAISDSIPKRNSNKNFAKKNTLWRFLPMPKAK